MQSSPGYWKPIEPDNCFTYAGNEAKQLRINEMIPAESQTAIVPDQAALMGIYVPAMRQRFKSEVNRLTSGAMAELLGACADADDLIFPLTYLYAFHWLNHNVPDNYRAEVLSAFRGSSRGFLMDLLLRAGNSADFADGYIRHWINVTGEAPLQRQQLLNLLQAQADDPQQLSRYILKVWDGLGLFSSDYKQAYAGLAKKERNRYRDMLGEADRQRLALLDTLESVQGKTARFDKLGLIPAMGCPQTCRHCMFIWRPLMGEHPDPKQLYELVDGLTDNLLFTGGDLTRHLDHFYRAIRSMRNITTFAILLNGDFADDASVTGTVLKTMADAIKGRPGHWAKARVLLQISFDEFHQEVVVDKRGQLKERIPVNKIANIVECAPRFAKQIQLCLLHKQQSLNFSMDLFRKGVFGRLVAELGARGHQVQILSTGPSSRLKRDPLGKGDPAPVLKDASFVLTRYPDCPMLLTSSTIDAYGRASLIEVGEALKETDLLRQVIHDGPPPGEVFDTDLMFWFNGWVTLFNAVHICLGNLYEEGAERILQRHHKDPLSAALHRFDRRLLDFYSEVKSDLDAQIAAATGPHHLFHVLTEDPEVRLHMTRRLLE